MVIVAEIRLEPVDKSAVEMSRRIWRGVYPDTAELAGWLVDLARGLLLGAKLHPSSRQRVEGTPPV
jgi:hypothetical protein